MVSSSGFMLGIVGGLLDFASATSLLLSGGTQTGMMGTGTSYDVVAAGLYVLGVVVIATALLSAMLFGMSHPRLFPGLMAVYGLVMVAVGWAMATDMTLASISSLYSYGMVVFGALMVVNAVLTVRNRVAM